MLRRGKPTRNPFLRLARALTVVRFSLRVYGLFWRLRRLAFMVVFGAAAAAVVAVVVRARRTPEPTPASSPAPAQPEAPGNGTVTERNLEAEKDA